MRLLLSKMQNVTENYEFTGQLPHLQSYCTVNGKGHRSSPVGLPSHQEHFFPPYSLRYL